MSYKYAAPDNVELNPETGLAEEIFSNEANLNTLLSTGDKDEYFQQLTNLLEDDPPSQYDFIEYCLESFFDESVERRKHVAILTTLLEYYENNIRLTPPFRSITSENPQIMVTAYNKVVMQLTERKSIPTGSIYTLLDIGLAISPYMGRSEEEGLSILETWLYVCPDYPKAKNDIISKLSECEAKMSPNPTRDYSVEKLKHQGLNNFEIAEQLEIHVNAVQQSVRRLISAGRIPEYENKVSAQMLQLLMEFRDQFPIGTVNLSKLTSSLGITKQRAHQIYGKLKEENPSLPLLTNVVTREKPEEYLTQLDNAVENLMEKGYTMPKIAESLGVTITLVRLSKERMYGDKRRQLEENIIELRNKGYGNKKISEILNQRVHQITYIAQKLLQEGRTQPIKSKRSPEEISQFAKQVKSLREKGLKITEIAEVLGEGTKTSAVNSAIRRLRQRGEIK